MDAQALLSAIGSVGFPIVACFAMFWFLQKEQESHKAEMQLVTDALNRNTDVLTELKTIISMVMKHENGSTE